MSKTNAIRILELHKVKFDTINYEVDESDLSGETVALKVGVNPETVLKHLFVLEIKPDTRCFAYRLHKNSILKKPLLQAEIKKLR